MRSRRRGRAARPRSARPRRSPPTSHTQYLAEGSVRLNLAHSSRSPVRLSPVTSAWLPQATGPAVDPVAKRESPRRVVRVLARYRSLTRIVGRRASLIELTPLGPAQQAERHHRTCSAFLAVREMFREMVSVSSLPHFGLPPAEPRSCFHAAAGVSSADKVSTPRRGKQRSRPLSSSPPRSPPAVLDL